MQEACRGGEAQRMQDRGMSCTPLYADLSEGEGVVGFRSDRRGGLCHGGRERRMVSSGAQLRARELGEFRRDQPDDPAEMLS